MVAAPSLLNLAPVQRGEALELGMRNTYILPTRFGLLWLLGIGLLQVVAIQLESNGPLLLSFLMLALFLLALHLTHDNLQGIALRCGTPGPGFVGMPLAYPLRLRCRSRSEGLRLVFGAAEPSAPRNLSPGEHALVVSWLPQHRGRCRPGRLRLFTTAPLGLFVCWSQWEPPLPQLIAPAPLPGPVALSAALPGPVAEAGAGSSGQEGGDLWDDLRPHRPEDGASRLAWKLLARGRGAQVKRFVAPPAQPMLLAPAPRQPREQALRHLCAAVLRLHGEGAVYGLELVGVRIPAGSGPSQRDRCLEALALAPGEP